MTSTNANNHNVRLRPPRDNDETAVRAAHHAMAPENFEFALGLKPDTAWPDYLRHLARQQAGVGLAADWVPATFLLADIDGQVVGRLSIRHRLNDWLLARGGHIGYGVLPSFRCRGIATEILRQGLIIARAVGIGRVLVTCDDTNIGSIRAIERCGGRLDRDWPTTSDSVAIRRYWIERLRGSAPPLAISGGRNGGHGPRADRRAGWSRSLFPKGATCRFLNSSEWSTREGATRRHARDSCPVATRDRRPPGPGPCGSGPPSQ